MNIQKKFSGYITLKDFVEEIKKDGCKGIDKIKPLDDGAFEVSYKADEEFIPLNRREEEEIN